MRYSMRQYRAEVESHSHSDFHQIIISDLGKLELEVEGRGGEVLGRRLAFVEAGKTHAYRSEGLNRFLVLDVNIDLATRTGIEALWHRHGSAAPYLEVRSGHQQGLARLLGGIAAANEDFDANGVRCLKTLLLGSQRVSGVGTVSQQELPSRLLRTMAWAEARLGEDISIGDLANVATQSQSSLFSAFQHHVGTSPMRWLTEQRLQMALALLRDPDIHISMSDLSNMVGFTDQSAFSRAFSRRFGYAPSAAKATAKA